MKIRTKQCTPESHGSELVLWVPLLNSPGLPGPSKSLSVLDTVMSSKDKVLALSTKLLYFYTSNYIGILGKEGLLSCQNLLAPSIKRVKAKDAALQDGPQPKTTQS